MNECCYVKIYVIITGEHMNQIPDELRKAVAELYLSRYKRIILWGSGINPVSVQFDALYTDMSWVNVSRSENVMESSDLEHYTDIFVK